MSVVVSGIKDTLMKAIHNLLRSFSGVILVVVSGIKDTLMKAIHNSSCYDLFLRLLLSAVSKIH